MNAELRDELIQETYERAKETLLGGGTLPDGTGFEEMCAPWEDEGALTTMVGEMIAYGSQQLEQDWENRASELASRYANGHRVAA